MKADLTATEAARRFSDLLNRVRYRGESFTITRGGEPVGRLVPVPGQRTLAQFFEDLAKAPAPDREFADDLEGVQRLGAAPPVAPWDS